MALTWAANKARSIPLLLSDVEIGTKEFGFIPRKPDESDPEEASDREDSRYQRHVRTLTGDKSWCCRQGYLVSDEPARYDVYDGTTQELIWQNAVLEDAATACQLSPQEVAHFMKADGEVWTCDQLVVLHGAVPDWTKERC